MSKCKFKIGDRVTIKEGLMVDKQYNGITFLWSMLPYCKKSGIIKFISMTGICTVGFKDTALYLTPCMLQHVNEKIIIYREDKKVIAENIATGKTGVAHCNPADEFDFNTGAKLAFERLTNPEPEKPKKPKYYTGKVVCIDDRGLSNTKGKIYKVLDGRLEFDGGYNSVERFESVDQINDMYTSKFIELVE